MDTLCRHIVNKPRILRRVQEEGTRRQQCAHGAFSQHPVLHALHVAGTRLHAQRHVRQLCEAHEPRLHFHQVGYCHQQLAAGLLCHQVPAAHHTRVDQRPAAHTGAGGRHHHLWRASQRAAVDGHRAGILLAVVGGLHWAPRGLLLLDQQVDVGGLCVGVAVGRERALRQVLAHALQAHQR